MERNLTGNNYITGTLDEVYLPLEFMVIVGAGEQGKSTINDPYMRVERMNGDKFIIHTKKDEYWKPYVTYQEVAEISNLLKFIEQLRKKKLFVLRKK